MARKPRIHYPGALYHVTLRGNDRQDIFFDVEDRQYFYSLLQDGLDRFGHRLHAFCLMTNHVHLAIQVADIPLSRIIQNLSFRYTNWVNRKYQRSGHLFQGRYKATLADGESYLLELIRYIHLNPARAGLVSSPEDYPWSSHQTYLGCESLAWVTTDWLLTQFADDEQSAKVHYQQFVSDGLAVDFGKVIAGGGCGDSRLLGDDQFAEKVLKEAEQRSQNKITINQLLSIIAANYELDLAQLKAVGKARRASEARAVAALMVQEYRIDTLTSLARCLGRELTTISSSARRVAERARGDEVLGKRIKVIRQEISRLQA